ncbi:6594_t:CDS:2 [Gigaspora margarita]|uniref:6594_t:CDS:1 n=1 Tax=Gigaspora margarita TaxID=4874 RepID=A0ABM8W474_GIGMA|nr:6594_t:CDS:2 [Gigaspora margarita]
MLPNAEDTYTIMESKHQLSGGSLDPRDEMDIDRTLREASVDTILKKGTIQTEETKDKAPNIVEELKQQIEHRNLQITLNFLITEQAEVLSAIEFLKQDLELELIPDFVFQLTSLLSPNWELFEIDETHTPG